MNLFWIFLKTEFDEYRLWEKDSVGVKKKFKVVWRESSSSGPTIGDIFGYLGFGQ